MKLIAGAGMTLAIIGTIILVLNQSSKITNVVFLVSALSVGTIIGRYLAYKVEMTGIPQLVSLFNAFGGMSAVIISLTEATISFGTPIKLLNELVLTSGAVLGAVSFSGSLIAYLKLSGVKSIKNFKVVKGLTVIVLVAIMLVSAFYFIIPDVHVPFTYFLIMVSFLSLCYGVVFSVPIGGADMPVLVSFLNAITGVATALAGIAFNSPIMMVGGILVGATGVFLTLEMCNAMNRSLKTVFAGNLTKKGTVNKDNAEVIDVQFSSPVELASILAFSKKVGIIPGYGMAVAQAQQVCYELQKRLMTRDVEVNYIIHPVAGRMPGHMNVLLAEANVDYQYIKDMDEVNDTMNTFDLVLVIGANDVVNPSAEEDKDCSIYGMPIIKAYQARQVIVLKRSMSAGYSGENNPLFGRQNCKLLLGDAKDSLANTLIELKKI
ncbi:NAD(P)(+) transhydrogenase (Re/Si-specific) subunit beta [Zhouia spongiae]|uniref:proton-translocating NAD(P)(+) transhydrogenase n=1 Tax=Zhouia spongiae TaxID=2202721 RepID=A0ABY3YKT1_9FLAO|nr:NAD(P)(+) transhydrogenase (Re/Si-specific) subunit beta [Zhouia spongiae]UNY98276.1 NAD(P)(+) transhydrogenase (Re/Si-specific) subunit beta [Zhouia spongiae]